VVYGKLIKNSVGAVKISKIYSEEKEAKFRCAEK
jgi:hypothetical protein